VADDNFLYGVLILVDRAERSLTTAERQGVQLTCLMLAAALRQAIVQEEAKKRIAELSVLFEVGKALSSTVELDELLERIVSTTAKVITARGAALHIINAAPVRSRSHPATARFLRNARPGPKYPPAVQPQNLLIIKENQRMRPAIPITVWWCPSPSRGS